jgi:type II secretory pathway predicted ATPase ExeA
MIGSSKSAPSARLKTKNIRRARVVLLGESRSGATRALSRAAVQRLLPSSRICVDGAMMPPSTAATRSTLQVTLATDLSGVMYQIG